MILIVYAASGILFLTNYSVVFCNTVNVQFLANALLEEATSMQKIMHNCIIRFLPV